MFANKIWNLCQNNDELLYKTLPYTDDDTAKQLLQSYFQLEVNLQDLYIQWSKADPHFAKIANRYPGVRVLRQDPNENLFSFLCSTNNNITRISSMVNNLCMLFGEVIQEVDGNAYYSFPTTEALASPVVQQILQQHKFGYRAGFISRTAQLIFTTKRQSWLHDLRKKPYTEARQQLLTLPGVGRKVADCVCLMSLDKTEAVPVDTHIFQLVKKLYLPHLHVRKSLSDQVYHSIGNHLQETFGHYAGWAHSVLFASDLTKFKSSSNKGMVETTKQTSSCCKKL